MENSYKWEAPEFEYKEKTSDWFWAVGIIALSAATTAYLLNDPLFSVVIIIGAVALALHSNKKPQLINYELDDRGVVIRDYRYLYSSLECFFVEWNGIQKPQIIIKSKKTFMFEIFIPIEGYHPDEIRAFLLQFLPEEELHEPLSHKVMEYLGF